jgi:hypothetical protein
MLRLQALKDVDLKALWDSAKELDMISYRRARIR